MALASSGRIPGVTSPVAARGSEAALDAACGWLAACPCDLVHSSGPVL